MRITEDMKDELGPFTLGIGGALAVAGSILPWAVVTFQAGPLGVVPSKLFTPVRHVMGTHTTEGKITLVVGLAVALLGIVGLLMRGRRAHTVIGLCAVLGAVALGALGIRELSRISDASAEFNPLHYPLRFGGVPQRHFVSVTTSWGLIVVLAGAGLALLGGVYALFRARRRSAARHFSG